MTGDEMPFADDIEAALQLPLVVARCVALETVARIGVWINALSEEDWRSGDESAHSWTEHHLASQEISRLMSEVPLLAALGDRATTMVGWVNKFRQGEWIAPHRDAAGDVHCIVPIVVPAMSQGGQLWIASPFQFVPAVAGDAVVFSAAAHTHGTSAVSAASAQRVTLNMRYWLRG
jgi:hypothetical protein